MKLINLLLVWAILASVKLTTVQCQNCVRQTCNPPSGELLLGRGDQITATSTCGLSGPQRYCRVTDSSSEKKCFTCDSRPGSNETESHLVSNIVASSGNRTWWQSENAVESVTLQVDFEAEFQLTYLIMTFVTFRPAGMIISRSKDGGVTWRPYQYFAERCTTTFPAISTSSRTIFNQVTCTETYSAPTPASGGQVIFIAIPSGTSNNYNRLDSRVLDWNTITNLRFQFVRLQTLGEDIGPTYQDNNEKYYYAISSLAIHGSCLCYGHASRCIPMPNISPAKLNIANMVHGRCDCQHFTAGTQCETCAPEYNDQPWVVGYQENRGCSACKCNNHTSTCRFSPPVYISSSNTTGSICTNCQGNTQGNQCDQCQANYYQQENTTLDSPNVCARCDCDVRGSTNAPCDRLTGICHCKSNVMGRRCDSCKVNYYGLNSSHPLGCLPCNCYNDGTVDNTICDMNSGQCTCELNVDGRRCERCKDTYWGLTSPSVQCRPCLCHSTGAYSLACNDSTGLCSCRKNLLLPRCNEVIANHYYSMMDSIKFEAEEQGVRDIIGASTVQTINRFYDYPYKLFTGAGYRIMQSNGTVRVVISVASTFRYQLLIRFEPVPELRNFSITVDIKTPPSGVPINCDIPLSKVQALNTSTDGAYITTPICFGRDKNYITDIQYINHERADVPLKLDSIVLLPSLTSVASVQLSTTLVKTLASAEAEYCLELFYKPYNVSVLSAACKEVMFTLSNVINDGGVACDCNPTGTISGTACDKVGGQCRCKSNIFGRRCDRCVPGAYGFGLPDGCRECRCDRQGSINFESCDENSGQCNCQRNIVGLNCNRCQYFYYGFPNCRRCECYGHSASCEQQNGTCLNCLHNTAGRNCDQCQVGFVGTATAGTPNDCERCECPGGSSGNQFSSTCYYRSTQSRTTIICDNCTTGYTGNNCELCAPGYYGDPTSIGGRCRPCQCNDNIDVNDPGSCNNQTGQCLKCLYNTNRPSCNQCQPGYYGNAVARTCRPCQCNQHGSVNGNCDPVTGQCTCHSNVIGRACDQCVKGFWNITGGNGCQACGCCGNNSIQTDCDTVTGKCNCIRGYSGNKCCDCEDGFWGDPSTTCYACNCDRMGSLSTQCDRKTGQCYCIATAGGLTCDRCAEGYHGTFPICRRCHTCFFDWNKRIQDFNNLAAIQMEKGQELINNGSFLFGFAGLQQLENDMTTVENMLQNKYTSMDQLDRIRQTLTDANRDLLLYQGETIQLNQNLTNIESLLPGMKTTIINDNATLADQDNQVSNIRIEFTNITESSSIGALASLNYSAQVAERYRQRALTAANKIKAAEIKLRVLTPRLTDIQNRQENDWQSIRALQNQTATVQTMVADINRFLCGTSTNQCDPTCGGMGCSLCGNTNNNCNGAVDMAATSNTIARENSITVIQKLRDLEAALRTRNDLSQRTNATLSEISSFISQVTADSQVWSRIYNNISQINNRLADILSQEWPNTTNIDRINTDITGIKLALSVPEIERLSDQLNATLQILEGNSGQQNSSIVSLVSAIRDRIAAIRAAIDGAEVAIADLQARFYEYNINKTRTSDNLGVLWGIFNRSHSTLNETIDVVAQMNASAVISLANVEEANTTTQAIENDEINLQNYTQMAGDTATIVESEMNITRQNLTDLQERYQSVSSRRSSTVAAVKPQSDLVHRLLGMINSIRMEAQNKLAAVKALQDDTLRQQQVLQDYSDEIAQMESRIGAATKAFQDRYAACYTQALARSTGSG